MIAAWALSVYGLTLVVTQSKIVAPTRRLLSRAPLVGKWLGDLLHCPLCFGWWAGFLVSAFARLGPAEALQLPLWPTHLANGFAASALCWVVHVTLYRLGARDL